MTFTGRGILRRCRRPQLQLPSHFLYQYRYHQLHPHHLHHLGTTHQHRFLVEEVSQKLPRPSPHHPPPPPHHLEMFELSHHHHLHRLEADIGDQGIEELFPRGRPHLWRVSEPRDWW